mmetsp:Transcript_1708/g.7455  ORF Transcript_1708/g.7455 Transcript_1708/m.7455 type:complete len:268 (+) Transcript_1708:2350-3153(+)
MSSCRQSKGLYHCARRPRVCAASCGVLEDELPEVLRRRQQVAHLDAHPLSVYHHVRARIHVGGVEADVVHEALDDRLQPTGSDVLDLAVDLRRRPRDLADRFVFEDQAHALHRDELYLLPDEVVDGLREDSVQVVLGELLQLDADWKAPLQLRQQIRRLRLMERAGRDEQNVVRVYIAVLRRHGGALYEGQQIPLDPFVRGVCASTVSMATDLVDLVDEDNPIFLRTLDRLANDVRVAAELLHLDFLKDPSRLVHLHLLPFHAAARS